MTGREVASSNKETPDTHREQQDINQAIEAVKVLQKRIGTITVRELLSAKHEGHRY